MKPGGTTIEATSPAMPHYVAIIEDAGPDDAVSLWFPDLPGCISGGDDVDEALENAPEALAFYAQELTEDGRELPPPRTLEELEADPAFAEDLGKHTAVLIEWPPPSEGTE
jgi:predicted RNase H-like HicB family nuclease